MEKGNNKTSDYHAWCLLRSHRLGNEFLCKVYSLDKVLADLRKKNAK